MASSFPRTEASEHFVADFNFHAAYQFRIDTYLGFYFALEPGLEVSHQVLQLSLAHRQTQK